MAARAARPRILIRILAGVGLVLGAAIALGCAGHRHVPVPPTGAVAVGPTTVFDFHGRADIFYQRLIQRRFNALETFSDPILREHFRSIERFFDYYADLASALDEADFERSRPRSVTVEEFIFESPSRVLVQVRFVGDDDRPLRPTRTSLRRVDRWERMDENWWVIPGKL